MNPDVWVSPGRNLDGTMGIAPNANVNKDTCGWILDILPYIV